jgi:DNA repair protein RecO (recombination protein O)
MSAEKTEAIVIRLADFSNTSRVVTFFTREFGRVAALAKGGKRLKGPFDTGLDLLSTCRIVFLRKSSSALDILTEAALLERFRPQAGTLNGFYAGCYVAELLSGLTADHDPHPVLYDAARGTLTAFQSATDIRLVVVWFELSLLKETGHLPDFNDCLHCGAPIEVSRSSSFRALPGGLLCPQCPPQEFIRQHIHAGTVALSRALTNSSTVLPPHLTATDQQIRELRFLLTSSISGLLGRRPGTLKFIEF